MPLTLPIDEAILQEVVTRLQDVSGATVVEYRREPGHWTPKDRQICVIKKNPERATELDYPGNPPATAWRMTINLRLHLVQSEEDTSAASGYMAELVADVMETLCAVANWWQWGSKAVLSDIGTVEYFRPTGSFDAALIPIVITFRHSEGDPYTVR